MGSMRFASEASFQQDPDISRWPGVYVHPGKFKPAAAKVQDDGEAWIRYRNRYRRLQAHRRLPKHDRRQRQREKLFVSAGHCRFRWFNSFAAARTAEQEGTYTVHQNITCHYHLYAPTTVHVSPDTRRCATESSSEASLKSSSPTAISRVSCEGSVHKLDLESDIKTQPEGKRQTILQ
jgi:hypothetical protein